MSMRSYHDFEDIDTCICVSTRRWSTSHNHEECIQHDKPVPYHDSHTMNVFVATHLLLRQAPIYCPRCRQGRPHTAAYGSFELLAVKGEKAGTCPVCRAPCGGSS